MSGFIIRTYSPDVLSYPILFARENPSSFFKKIASTFEYFFAISSIIPGEPSVEPLSTTIISNNDVSS